MTYTEHSKRKTVTALDVVYALKRSGKAGFPTNASQYALIETLPDSVRLRRMSLGSTGICYLYPLSVFGRRFVFLMHIEQSDSRVALGENESIIPADVAAFIVRPCTAYRGRPNLPGEVANTRGLA